MAGVTRAAVDEGVRRTLAGLVETALVPHERPNGINGATYFTLDPRVLSMLAASAASTTEERSLQAALPRASQTFRLRKDQTTHMVLPCSSRVRVFGSGRTQLLSKVNEKAEVTVTRSPIVESPGGIERNTKRASGAEMGT